MSTKKPAAKTAPANPATSLRAISEGGTGGVTKSTTFRVDPNLVTFEKGFNLREPNDELDLHIDRLYASMKAGAFIPPVDVQINDKGEIVARDGHCRTKAARKLRKEMPEYTLECRQLRGNEVDAVLHMLGTGSGQKPLTPLEQGRGYLRLVKMGLKSQDIADKLGVSRVTVDNGLTLAEAPVEVQQLISNGEVSSTTAREALKQGPEAVAALKKAADEERANPTPTKAGKQSTKKKVTAKKLQGTAADKTKNKKNAKKGPKKGPKKTIAEWNKELEMNIQPESPAAAEAKFTKAEFLALAGTPAAESVAEGEIMVKVNKFQAQAAVDFLKANAPDGVEGALVKSFAAALEMVLL